MPHLSKNGLFGMIFEHLQKHFHLEDLANGFPHIFPFYFHITQGHIPYRITHVLGAAHFLTITKPSSGIHPIAMGEVLYSFISCAKLSISQCLCKHFSLHQFGIATKGVCEVVIHSISYTLDLHLN